MSTDDHLQRFATKVVELQEKKERRIDEELMRDVARELGMSEEDLLKAKEEGRAHKTRAQSLRAAGNLDAAIDELESAFAFNPLDAEVMYMLADGLFTRSQRTQDDAEWSRAKDLCVQVIEIVPAHKEAPALLNAINNRAPEKRSDNAIPTGILVGVGVLLALVVGVLVAFVL
jgi:tetratricopeptide (TPR) repeat protein